MALWRRLAVLLCAVGLVGPAYASASTTQESILQDDDMLLYGGPAKADATLRELKALGVDRVRVSIHWGNVAPERRGALGNPLDPSQYDRAEFDGVDHLLRSARAHGISVLLTVAGPAPDWAVSRADGAPAGRNVAPSPAEFAAFVQMLGTRWSGSYRDENQGGDVLPRVSAWSLWNEPNWHGQLMPQWRRHSSGAAVPFAPRWYRRLYRAGVAALDRSGHGADIILLGETAPLGSMGKTPRSPLRPVTFLRDLFCMHANGKPMTGRSARRRSCDFDRRGAIRATGYAHHPYPIMSAPGRANRDRLAITLADSQRLKTILDQAAALGRVTPNLPLWYTEFGWQTGPPDPFRGVSLENHARWLGEAERITWSDPRVVAHGQFLLRDDEPRGAYPADDRRHWATWQSGLQFADGSRKPAYDAYRLPFAAPKRVAAGFPLEVWGMVRPGGTGQAQSVTLQRRGTPEEGWSNVADLSVTDARGYFTAAISAPRPGEYRFVWTPPDGGEQPGILGRRAPQNSAPVASAPVQVTVG